MARIDRTSISHEAYHSIRASAAAATGERADCAVVAVAAACEVSYDEAHAALAAQGRKPRHGTYYQQTHNAIKALGFTLVRIPPEHFIQQYPKAHQVLRSVTTHHPDRFARVWRDGHTYLVHVARHVLTVRNGVNMDWSRGRAKRAIAIYRIVRNDLDAKFQEFLAANRVSNP